MIPIPADPGEAKQPSWCAGSGDGALRLHHRRRDVGDDGIVGCCVRERFPLLVLALFQQVCFISSCMAKRMSSICFSRLSGGCAQFGGEPRKYFGHRLQFLGPGGGTVLLVLGAAVQRMLGHSSAAMSLTVYADLFDEDLDAVADALDHGVSQANVPKQGFPCKEKSPYIRLAVDIRGFPMWR